MLEKNDQLKLQREVAAARKAMAEIIGKRYPEITDQDLLNYLVEIEMADPTEEEAARMSRAISSDYTYQLLERGKKFLEEDEKPNKGAKKSVAKKSVVKKAAKKSGARKVICITTGLTFDSMKQAAEFYGLKSASGISKCCKGDQKTSGTYNGKKLVWQFA